MKLAFSLVALVPLAAPSPAQATYTFEALPTLGGTESFALGLNDHGDVVGQSRLANGQARATLWGGGQVVDLGTLGGDESIAYDVNGAGRIVGRTTLFTGPFQTAAAFRLDAGEPAATPLENLMDHFNGVGRTVSESGRVAGFTGGFDTTFGAFWDESGELRVVAPLFHVGPVALHDVWGSNELGDLVGQSLSTDLSSGFTGLQAALWRDAKEGTLPEPLGTLGGSASFARAINESRQVVGAAGLASPAELHAFLWEAGTMTDLGDLAPGATVFSSALDLNDAGVVVGTSLTGNGAELRAFVWDGAMHDLNDLAALPPGWVLEEAHAINAHGQVVGRATDPAGATRGFLLTPEDVPDALPMVADPDELSLSAGGQQSWTIRGGLPNGGQLYLVLGSASGTTPGLALGGGVVLPLAADAYLGFSFKKANQGPFVDTFGVLDATGRASAAFAVAPGSDPALAGLALFHAFAVLDATTLAALFAGNGVSVSLAP